MKTVLFLVVSLTTIATALGQGQINFQTRIPPDILDAKVIRFGDWGSTTGLGAGEGFTAELVMVGKGEALTPLLPKTVFGTRTPADTYYVEPVIVTVPGFPAGSQIMVRMRVFETVAGNYESSRFKTISSDVHLTLGSPDSPANLNGLTTMGLVNIPEPSTLALLAFASMGLFFRR